MKDDSEKNDKACLDNKTHEQNDESGCPWWINSPEHKNCLWIYISDKSAPDGSMPELVQSEIAQLLGWSNTKTHFMLKQAMEELVEALRKYQARQLLNSESDPTIDLITYHLDPISNSTSEENE